MSNRTTKPALVMPMTDADLTGTVEHYPRQLVVPGVLAFCLTVWAIVIFAVAHYA